MNQSDPDGIERRRDEVHAALTEIEGGLARLTGRASVPTTWLPPIVAGATALALAWMLRSLWNRRG